VSLFVYILLRRYYIGNHIILGIIATITVNGIIRRILVVIVYSIRLPCVDSNLSLGSMHYDYLAPVYLCQVITELMTHRFGP